MGCSNKSFTSSIKYSEVGFACIHNGNYMSDIKIGQIPNLKTARIGCWFALNSGLQLMDSSSS